MLPGTISAADRYVRADYNLKSSPKFQDRREVLASVFSQMRGVSPPLGMSDPEKPNISSTLYRIVADSDAKRYYFDNVLDPSVFYVDLSKVVHAWPTLSRSGRCRCDAVCLDVGT